MRADRRFPHPLRAQTGFSLLEVLVAFSILALSLGVLLQVFASGSRSAAASERYSTALMIAESKMAEAGRIDRDQIEGSGEFADIYRWEVTAEPFQDEVFDDTLSRMEAYAVTVRVSWQEGGRRPAVTLSGLRLVSRR